MLARLKPATDSRLITGWNLKPLHRFMHRREVGYDYEIYQEYR